MKRPLNPETPSREQAPSSDPSSLREAEAWIFDLDNTLYCATTNLFGQIDVRMKGFISEYLDLDLDSAYKVQKTYFREFGTTLRGLMVRHGLDPLEFLNYVHDIDVSVITPNPGLNEALERLKGRKIIFTNASTKHASRVLSRLGIEHHFEQVFDIASSDYIPKPEPLIYDKLVKQYAFDPSRSIMVEDMARNLKPAADLGMTTVWVKTASDWGQEGSGEDYVHHRTDNLSEWLAGVTTR